MCPGSELRHEWWGLRLWVCADGQVRMHWCDLWGSAWFPPHALYGLVPKVGLSSAGRACTLSAGGRAYPGCWWHPTTPDDPKKGPSQQP